MIAYWKRYTVLATLVASVALFPWFAGLSGGGPPLLVLEDKLEKPKERKKLTKFYYGAGRCSDLKCHNDISQPMEEGANIILSNYDEFQVWSKVDKHSMAHLVLKGERAKKMGELLLIDNVAKDQRCISCHGIHVEEKDLVGAARFKLEEGVSCGVCHGFHKEWIAEHSVNREDWRTRPKQEKQDAFGMTDLRNPETRTKLCASCHIGNTAEKKVVTHAMYAAGHPPLPGFEVASFCDAMPRHWKYVAERSEKVHAIPEYDPAKIGLERTQLVVIGALVSFRESMNLLETQAKQGTEAKEDGNAWPELAQFDCIACHHDLKSPSWRQERGYAGKVPGRPDMRSWPLALVHLSILHASNNNPDREKALTNVFNDKMKAVNAAFNARPFGDPKTVATAANEASGWADGLLKEIANMEKEKKDSGEKKELKEVPFDRNAADRIVLAIGKDANRRAPDFDSARQMSWAIRAILKEVDPMRYDPKPAKDKMPRIFDDLDNQLKLNFPAGKVEIGNEFLKESLDSLNAYDPKLFQHSLERLLEKIDKKPK